MDHDPAAAAAARAVATVLDAATGPGRGAMITSVDGWGITCAYSLLAHYYRVPLLVLVGAVRPQPTAVADEVVVRPVLTLTATFDHRYADGFHAARFAGAVREYCENPAAFEPPAAAGAGRPRAAG